MLLPHLKGQINFGIVANQTPLSANHTKTKFGFAQAATNYNEALNSETPAAVLIATRHNLHAPLVKLALAKNHQVFVEKPLCLTREELAELDDANSKSHGSVMVGFNRRFAPATLEIKKKLAKVPGPKSAVYCVFAGKLDPQHWYANYTESGGRIVGEACHFLDYFCFLFESKPTRVFAQTTWAPAGPTPFPDSIAAQVEFEDGSCGQLIYSAEGDWSYPKERCTIYASGVIVELENFQKLSIHSGRKKKDMAFSSKGHAEEMKAWLTYLQGQGPHPLPYDQSRQSMLLTFAVLESIQKGAAVSLS
jgi:predicted dehydrogenase